MQIGCHISIRNGYLEAAKTAVRLGAESFQYFPKNPRSLSVKAFNRHDAEQCALFCREQNMLTIAHTPYPTNLAQDEGEQRRATVTSLRNDLDIADACGSVGVVVHFGKYKGLDPLQGYKNIIQCLNEVLSGYKGQALLLIENQAGEGVKMGTTLEEHMMIRQFCAFPEMIGFCFDTCHAFASGLWPANVDGWRQLEQKAQELGFLQQLRALHLNDSVYPRGSGKDRHAAIGKGEMGEDRFISLLQSSRLAQQAGLPVVLETPIVRGTTHASEIRYVKELSGA